MRSGGGADTRFTGAISATEGRAARSAALLPDGVKDSRAGWATDIYAAFAALDHPTDTREHLCRHRRDRTGVGDFRSTRWLPGLA